MKSIIVPVDFSPVSMNAVHYATNLALSIEGSLVLFNVYHFPMTFTEVPLVTVGVDEMRELSEKRLSELKDSINHITSGRIRIFTVSSLGDVVEELNKLCSKLKPLMVAMGSTGHGSIHNIVVGSNTLRAIQTVKTPILVVPPGTIYHVPKTIGMATDMELVADSIPSDTIVSIVGLFNSKLHVLNINVSDKPMQNPFHQQSLLLENLLSGLETEYHFIDGEDVVDSIQLFSEVNNLDWLLVIPRIHRGFENLLHKSVSRQMVTQSRIPIVCLHA